MFSKKGKFDSTLPDYSENEEIDTDEFQKESSNFFLYLQQNFDLKVDEPINICPDYACSGKKYRQWSLSNFEQRVKGYMEGKFLKDARHDAIFKFIQSVKHAENDKSLLISRPCFSTTVLYMWPPTAIVYFYEPDSLIQTSQIVKETLIGKKAGPIKVREVWETKINGRTGYHLVDFDGDMFGLHNALLMTQSFKDISCGRESFLSLLKEAGGKPRGEMYGWIATTADEKDLPRVVIDKLMKDKVCVTVAEAQKQFSYSKIAEI